MDWDKIKMGQPITYRASPDAIKSDRVKVELDMPVEVYSDFQKQIHASHALRGRRTEDKE